MPRVLRYATPELAAAAQAQADLLKFAGVGAEKKKRKWVPERPKIRAETKAMMDAKDFSDIRPQHFVALYEWSHGQAYKVLPVEIDTADVWRRATMAAGDMLTQQFDGNTEAMLDFMRWTWRREAKRVREYHLGKTDKFSPIGWRLQFLPGFLLTTYRMEAVSAGGK